MTAGEVVDRIKKNLGAPWRENTYRDTFKSGSPETPVTGIATTVFASFDVIQRAVAAGLNMIIPHEVTYWNDRDDKSVVDTDPLVTSRSSSTSSHTRSSSSGRTIPCTTSGRTSHMWAAGASWGSTRGTRRRPDRIDSRFPR